jgi:two-component system, NarL family, invasion response regulator UvrY
VIKSISILQENLVNGTINVLIVDDHDLIRYGIKKLLGEARDINVVGEAASGEAAVKLARELNPDIVLMDLKMPGIGGIEATHKLLRANSKIKVIAVTSCNEEPFPYRLVRAGASGYVTKTADVEELLTAIRRVYSGHVYITPEIAQQMALRQATNASKSPFAELSERELQVMWMITHGHKVHEIAEKLCLSPKTVNTYRYRLFEKLKVRNDVELTHLALHYGMLDKDPG